MQTQTGSEEFSDLKSHKQMYASYTGMLVKGIVTVLVIVVFTAWVTGVF